MDINIYLSTCSTRKRKVPFLISTHENKQYYIGVYIIVRYVAIIRVQGGTVGFQQNLVMISVSSRML